MTRILVVEDSATQAQELQFILESSDFEVEIVPDGRQTLERLRASPYEMVLSDIMMPGMSGYEICRAIKADPSLQQIPVILLTTLSDPMNILQALECGADNFLTKPYDPDHLVAHIKAIFANKRSREEAGRDSGVEIAFLGRRFKITSGREQILDLLVSTFEEVTRHNRELVATKAELAHEAQRLATANDELVRARELADRASQVKSEFLANMSHELRTPLNAIIGFSDIMHSGMVGPLSPDHLDYIGDILTSGRHLLQLVNEVLDLAKIESGTLEFYPEPVDLDEVTREVTDTLGVLAKAKHLRIERHVDPAVSPARLDRARLKQILYNYLSNAIKFTPDLGRVTLRIGPAPHDRILIEVEDTGIGIAPADIGRLFHDFQQLDAGKAKKHEGTGIGLALTKRIVEAQGGVVAIRSIEGQGSVFSVVMPRDAAGIVVPARG